MTSDFSNPAADASETADAYVARLLALLGDRDPVQVQAQLIDKVRDLVHGLSDEQLRFREARGKWSILEVVQHLADTEVVYRYRMRMSVAQPGSPIPNYDQDQWATGLRYNEGSLEDVLRELELFRAANLAWVASLSEDELDRAGIHEERGRESVRRIVELLAAHDIVHCRQIERGKAAL